MSLTSLLVCDDARAVQVLSRVLVELGISAQQCDDFDLALERLTSHPFDALLVDCEEEASAVQLVAEAKSSPDNNSALIVGLVDSRNNVRGLFDRGINFVLYKPISHERSCTVSGDGTRGLLCTQPLPWTTPGKRTFPPLFWKSARVGSRFNASAGFRHAARFTFNSCCPSINPQFACRGR